MKLAQHDFERKQLAIENNAWYEVDFSPPDHIRYLSQALAERKGVEISYGGRSFSPRAVTNQMRSSEHTPSSGEVAKYMRDMRARREKSEFIAQGLQSIQTNLKDEPEREDFIQWVINLYDDFDEEFNYKHSR